MSKEENEIWPLITEKKKHRKGGQTIREFTIKDARNLWEIETIKAEEVSFTIKGFSRFFFKFDGDTLRCYKKLVVRASDSGQLASFDDRFNLTDDKGNRKTLRLKNLKQYIKGLFK